MRNRHCRNLIALILLAVLAPALAVWASRERARLLRVQGLVKVKSAGTSSWAKACLPQNSCLAERDEVQTYQQAHATIGIDGGNIYMNPLTHVIIPPAQPLRGRHTPSRLTLLRGKILIWLIGGRPLEIGTAGAVAAAKSTQFVVETDDSGATVLTVIEGNVEFYNRAGSVMVGPDQQSTATPGCAPTRPARVDKSSYLEWEATLKSLWLGYEKLYHPGDSAEALRQKADAAVQKAAGGDAADLESTGDLLHDTGDLNAADEAYRKALEVSPNRPQTELKLGYNLLQQGRAEEARVLFDRLATSGYAPARTGLVLALAAGAQTGQTAAAQAADAAARLDRADPEAQLALGLLAMRCGQADAACAAFTQAAQASAPDHRAFAYLSAVQLAQGNGKVALAAAQRAVALAPASALAHESLGTAAFYCGTLSEAAAEACRALALNPHSANAQLLAANVAVAQGDLDAGLQAAEAAVELDPCLAGAHYAIGMIALSQNDLKRAERELGKALVLQPQMVSAQAGMGLTYARQDRLAKAFDLLEGAAALDPGAAAVQNNIGLIYLQTGRLAQAIDTFHEALRLQPGWAIVHANLALAYLESYEYAQARTEAERAVALGGDSARVRTTLARVYLRQNRVNAAWAQLRRALELDPDYALAHFHLAEVYLALGRPEDAQRERFRALSLQPSAMVDNRQYARTEIEATAGDLFNVTAHTMGRGDGGQNSFFLAGQRTTGDLDRPRTDARDTTLLGIAGRQTAADRTTVLYATAESQNQDRPGPALDGGLPADTDDVSAFRGREAQALTRQGIWGNGDLTLRAGYWEARQSEQNPDSLLPADSNPLRTLDLTQSGPVAEFRVDKPLCPRNLLTFGTAWMSQRNAIEGTLGTAGTPPTFAPFSNIDTRQIGTGYVEFQRLLDPCTTIMIGGRAAVAEEATPVLRPKAWLRHDVGHNASLVLLTRPVLADDVSQIAPVDWYGLRDFASPSDLARGGYAQSYELQYELVPPGGVYRASLFQRDLRNLLVDLEDPAWSIEAAPLLLGSATVKGAQLELEPQLGRCLTGGLFVRYASSSNDDAGGREVPYLPRWTGQARLDYLDNNGWRAGLIWSFVGRRFADADNTVELGSYGVLSAQVARQFNLHTDVFVNVENVLNREYEFYRDYPSAGVQFSGGVKYRF